MLAYHEFGCFRASSWSSSISLMGSDSSWFISFIKVLTTFDRLILFLLLFKLFTIISSLIWSLYLINSIFDFIYQSWVLIPELLKINEIVKSYIWVPFLTTGSEFSATSLNFKSSLQNLDFVFWAGVIFLALHFR